MVDVVEVTADMEIRVAEVAEGGGLAGRGQF